MEKVKYINFIISETQLAGFVDFLRKSQSIDIVSIYYMFDNSKIVDLDLNRNEARKPVQTQDIKKAGIEPFRTNQFSRLIAKELINNEIKRIEQAIIKYHEIGIKPYIAIDTNISRNGFLEAIFEKIIQNIELWKNIKIVVPRIVIQELFQKFSTDIFKGSKFKERGIEGFPKFESRISRYALAIILRGMREGICEIHGRTLLLKTGRETFGYLSDLVLIDQLEEYRQLNPSTHIIFVTSDFALSAISPIQPTIYLRPVTGKMYGKISRLPEYLRYLVIVGGLIAVKTKDFISILSYSWKGITLEDYYNKCICVSIPLELEDDFKKFIEVKSVIDYEKTPWLKSIEKNLF